MRIAIDTEEKALACESTAGREQMSLYSDRAFEILSHQWTKVGWSRKYSYTFTCLGRPLIQLPEDILRIQEIIWSVKPDVVVETGVAQVGGPVTT